MKENVLDILMYLFDNYFCEEVQEADEGEIATELAQAGFEAIEINKAFDWLGDLANPEEEESYYSSPSQHSLRVFTPDEISKLTPECRGFLINLETLGVLDLRAREIIIERAMAIDSDDLTLAQFKRVIGLVLLNRPNRDEGLMAWIDELIFDEIGSPVH